MGFLCGLEQARLFERNRLRAAFLILVLIVVVMTFFLFVFESNSYLPPFLKILDDSGSDKTALNRSSYGRCTPHRPGQDSIEMVKKIYKLDPSLTKCKQPASETICRTILRSEGVDNFVGDFKVQCFAVCKENVKSQSLEVNTVRSGKITNAGLYQTLNDLEKGVFDVIKENIKRNVHFVVIRCTSKTKSSKISQILPIDPRLTIKRNTTTPRDKNVINVNILLTDSVSRAHFLRSLPRTVEQFKYWKNNPATSPARVFDFELFQAVHGHTFENTYALFNGRLFPLEETGGGQNVNPGHMFGAFKKSGFQTMWQEDLCWKGVWGLKMDLVASSWDHLQQRLKENYIDHVGLTDSTCEVLENVYGVNNPFYNPIQLCYGGRFQHEFFFNYTLDTLKAIANDSHALPLVTYMASNVGHDHTGRRIQSHDLTLLEYVKELAELEDTITVLLADHGNTYTQYTVSVIEGRFEMFHPHLFIIIPNKVAHRLGQDALSALDLNQRRLLTILDLHESIMTLQHPISGRVPPKGLFAPIPKTRSCNDIELRRPNLCVCEGWDTPVKKDDTKLALVEFAVGMLNEELDRQLMTRTNASNRTLYPRSCIRLRAVEYSEVRERKETDVLYTSMLISVGAANLKGKEKFNVELQSREAYTGLLELKLSHFDRLSQYGIYRKCADKGASLKLCSCLSQSKTVPRVTQRMNVTQLLAPSGRTYLGDQTITKLKINQEGCLYLISRSHKKISFAYELTNVCRERVFKLKVSARSRGVKFSRECPFVMEIAVGTRFLFSARVAMNNLKHQAFVNVNVNLVT